MLDKIQHLKDTPPLIVYLLGIFIIWGGVTNYIRRTKDNEPLFTKLGLMVLDIFISGGTALIAYTGLIGSGFTQEFSVAVAGVASHFGVRTIYLLELVIAEKINSRALKNDALKGNKK